MYSITELEKVKSINIKINIAKNCSFININIF